MIHVLKENVEIIIDEKELSKYSKLGFKMLGASETQAPKDSIKTVPLSKMKLDDLKTLAKELDLEHDGLNCDELRKIIKDAQGEQ